MGRQTTHHRRRAASVALAAMLAAGAASAQERFEARLSSAAEDLATRDDMAGVGRARASLQGDQLTVTAEYQGLASNATAADLRQGYAIGAPSDAVVGPLKVSGGQQGMVTGALTLTASQRAAMEAGWMYVQIDSEKAPDGNLWGWLLPPRTPGR